MNSELAIKLYVAIKENLIKTRKDFWDNFFNKENVEKINISEKYRQEILSNKINLICFFDKDFPFPSNNISKKDMPFLFAYKGDIKLLSYTNKNVAVIGVTSPSNSVIDRERKFLEILAKNDINIISGLAKGCDTVAHKTCLNNGGKTVAFLPSTLNKIYPFENKELAERIEKNGGLIITEYVTEPKDKFEIIKRFISRDRLQAMYVKAVILTASFSKGNGDSGARHALQKAKLYNVQRYVLYNEKTDSSNKMFDLNKEQIDDGATILTEKNIKNLCTVL